MKEAKHVSTTHVTCHKDIYFFPTVTTTTGSDSVNELFFTNLGASAWQQLLLMAFINCVMLRKAREVGAQYSTKRVEAWRVIDVRACVAGD